MVVLPRQEYEALLNALSELREDAADAAAYDAARAELVSARVPPFPAQLNALLRQGKRRITAIREWRGLGLSGLAAATGLSPERLGQMEAGEPMQRSEEAALLASALNVPLGWLEP